MPNRLANETSPYLLQHADNPVDWYPWGEAAFAEARASDRPILLSVGYSSCHWCHVMAHESFEDESIADLMNRFFVNVKVDREERPDVDSVYMGAVQAMTGQGGWPMTVFITPNGEPFYAGTYFPRDDAFGRPGFGRVLLALHEAWTQQRDNLMQTANEVVDHLRKAAAIRGDGPLSPDDAVAESAVDRLIASFDREWGGFGDAPKFPAPSTIEFLLAHHVRTADPTRGIPDMVNLTLRRMWSGGMYDHLGGGFSRYSVDRQWVVPHFEKMLYDNAQLARVYLHAHQLFGEKLHLEVARETLDYLLREMLDREGGFYSAQDADSEGIEGKYFVWTVAELRDLLGDDAEAAITEFGLTEEGNFHDPHHPELTGRNVLTRRSRKPLRAEQYSAIRKRLFEARSKRIPPGLDDKVLASWNGLALAAFADAARVLDDERYLEAARRNAAFVREKMWRDGRLLHSYKDGEARVAGLLDDYALYGLGLIELYKATGELAHLEWAKAMFEVLEEHFRDENGGYFEAPDDGEELLVRQKPLFDASVPSGNGAAAQLAWQIGRYFDRRDWERRALEILGMVERGLREVPSGFGSVLQVVELALAERRELVTVGPLDARKPLDAAAARIFAPHLLVAPTERAEGLPHFDGRGPGERALAYVCTNMVCKLPVDDPHALAKQLEAGS